MQAAGEELPWTVTGLERRQELEEGKPIQQERAQGEARRRRPDVVNSGISVSAEQPPEVLTRAKSRDYTAKPLKNTTGRARRSAPVSGGPQSNAALLEPSFAGGGRECAWVVLQKGTGCPSSLEALVWGEDAPQSLPCLSPAWERCVPKAGGTKS